ncbi:MAG: hypothetical protein F6K11_09040 [Leptolyngbya sp. SIO3F4]|nr:hypothetical protein [Leptolyngbya sp. SIO3F4]
MLDDRYIWFQPKKREDGKLNIVTTKELFEQADQERTYFFDNLQYWTYDSTHKTLTHVQKGYEVELEKVSSKAEYLEWIMHLHGKIWMTANAFVELVTAFQYLIRRNQLPAE